MVFDIDYPAPKNKQTNKQTMFQFWRQREKPVATVSLLPTNHFATITFEISTLCYADGAMKMCDRDDAKSWDTKIGSIFFSLQAIFKHSM